MIRDSHTQIKFLKNYNFSPTYSVFTIPNFFQETYCKSGIVITLGGKPWLDIKSMSAAARSLLHKMVNFLGMVGWELITTARVKNARDTLFFMKTRTAPAINDLVRSFFR